MSVPPARRPRSEAPYPQDDASALCCCEYFNRRGERTHILQFCCACEEIDEAFDTLIRGNKVGRDRLDEILGEVDDRMRLPMFGGAWQIGLPGTVPWLVLPVHLMFASIGVRCLLLSAAVMLPSLLWWHRRMLRMRRRSNFLFSWVLASLGFELLVYWSFGVSQRQPTSATALFVALIGLALGCLARVRGVSPESARHVADAAGAEARAVRCAVCGHAVPRYDHYCAWTDSPIGAANHRAYLCFVVALLCGCALGGTQLASAAVARRGVEGLAGVWATLSSGRSGLLLVCALYAAVVTLPLVALLSHQLLLIARGVTTYEARKRLAPPAHPGGSSFLRQTAPLTAGLLEGAAAMASAWRGKPAGRED